MIKNITAILLAISCAVLAMMLYRSNQNTALLEQQIAEMEAMPEIATSPVVEAPAGKPVAVAQTESAAVARQEEEPPAPAEKESSGRRRMKSIAKMMGNPTMNKVMEASQRGAVGALYSDLIEYLDLDAEETKYFMDLLMFRQMKQVDLSMKMMGGNMTPKEKQQMQAELREVGETVKTEMEKFLNNPDDLAEFEFYEKTMGERMMLSQMDKDLANSDAALSDEAYRGLLDMMHNERKSFQFTSNLHDEKNTDISPERFLQKNVRDFANDMDQLNASILQRAQSMVTPEQLAAFEQALKSTSEMQKAQLETAAQMLGQKK